MLPQLPDSMFPKLDDAQITRLIPFGQQGDVEAGAVIVNQGDSQHGIFVVLKGSLEVRNVSAGEGPTLRVLGPGEFTGEVNVLSGRRTLVRIQAREAGTLLEINRANLRHIMQTDVALGEIFLTAFISRRVFLIANSVGDAVLIGSSHSSDTMRLREFLTRNAHPHHYLDIETDPTVHAILEQFGIPLTDIPVLICRGDQALRNPSNAEAAACFGLNDEIDQGEVCDLIVVGGGPSGLAAAVIGLAAPAAAAPTGPGNAQQTISELQSQGYTVIVNRIGTAPLAQASVVAVRPGQTYSRTDSGVPGAGNDIYTTVTDKTVYVDVK